MRLSCYLFGYPVVIVDLDDTSNATYKQNPEPAVSTLRRWIRRGIKKASTVWVGEMASS